MKGKLAGMVMAGIWSITAWAGSMGDVSPEEIRRNVCSKVITLGLGPAWYNNEGGTQRNLYFFPPLTLHTYVPEHTSGVIGSGELFFGLARPLTNQLAGQLGIAVGYSGNGKLSGHLNIGEPAVATYPYSYSVSSARIALKGKLVSAWNYWAKPYISGSAGVGFNRSWDYDSPYTIYPLGLHPTFSNNTAVGFAYTAGIGIQANINPQWQLGVGYEFSDWGKNSLHEPSLTLLDGTFLQYHGLHSNSFYTQSVQFSVSYIL